jgi:error-prone DNA polymerase
MRSYAELSCRSGFSFLQGASLPIELFKEAAKQNYHSLFLTDRQGFYGMVRAFEASEETSLPFRTGVELSLENSSVILLVRDLKGYQNLCRFLSDGFRGQEKGQIHIDRDLFEKWIDPQHHFIVLPPRDFPSDSLLEWYVKNIPFTQLVTRRFQADDDARMKSWLQKIPKHIPKAWTWDVFFHRPERYELFQVMESIRLNTPLSDRPVTRNAQSYLQSLQSLSDHKVPLEWTQRSVEISEACEFSPKEIQYRYPQEWLPKNKTPRSFLRELCEEGLLKRFPNGASQKVLAQLEHELNLIKEMAYEDYFLTVWDIVRFARSRNILCQGRGSAANSVVCYLLEITSIDPIHMNLLFERFITKERDEAPDIDVDFEHERREEVIQYVYRKYGRHRAGLVATLITYRTKSAVRDVGKALGFSLSQLDELSHRARWRENILEVESDSADPKLRRLVRLAKELKGFPKHLGQHTGGMILCQNRLDEISPIEPARMENRSLVQWDKYDVEKLGLLKVDLLSLGMLTCLRKNFDLLRKHQIADIALHQLPSDDPKTYEMIGKAKTVGLFQIESRAQMSMLPRLKPKNFYDLVVEVAIVRPGPLQGGMVHPYLRRRAGLEPIEYAHPKLRPILEKTLGVPIFQEQVMKMAIDVAGYTPGEADRLRRAMGAWRKQGNLQEHAEALQKRLEQQGSPKEFAERICKQILGFGEYGFPESHAASFALLTYASAYLKAHYPAAFLCSLLNSLPMGFYPSHVLHSSFRKENIKILEVSMALSEWDHQLEKTAKGEWAVRLGFRCVKGLSKENTQKFLADRDPVDSDSAINWSFFDREERSRLALLTQVNRRDAYWKSLLPLPDPFEKIAPEAGKEKSIDWKEPSPWEHLHLDFELMESSLREDPVQMTKRLYWNYSVSQDRLTRSSELLKKSNGSFVYVFGMMQGIQSPPTAKGMVFITLEDEDGFLNLILDPKVFETYKPLIQKEWALLVGGRLQSANDYCSIKAQVFVPTQKSLAKRIDIDFQSQFRTRHFIYNQKR